MYMMKLVFIYTWFSQYYNQFLTSSLKILDLRKMSRFFFSNVRELGSQVPDFLHVWKQLILFLKFVEVINLIFRKYSNHALKIIQYSKCIFNIPNTFSKKQNSNIIQYQHCWFFMNMNLNFFNIASTANPYS